MSVQSKRLVRALLIAFCLSFGLLFGLLISACGKIDAPVKDAGAKASETKAPAPTSKDTVPPGSSSNAQAEWEGLLAAAKKEGKLVLSGAPGELWRKALVEPFAKKYPEIKIEYSGLNGRDFWPKVSQERKVDQYLWDLRIGGSNDAYNSIKENMIDPVRPLLLIPEITDGTKWLGGIDGIFVDKEKKYIPSFLAYAVSTVNVNRDILPESVFKSPEQLLDPKFKGKIVLNDPRGGAGLGYLTVLSAQYGEKFISDLLTNQDVVITKDNRQMTEWVVRGRYPIAIGLDSTNLEIFQQQGLGMNVKDVEEGPIGLSIGFGSIQLMNKAPHPKAAQVYINWLLSKEAQTEIVQIVKLNSRRLDVAPGDKTTVVDPKKLNQYISHQEEQYVDLRKKTQDLSTKLIK